MKISESFFDGLLIIEPNVIQDSRGYFMESYSKRKLDEAGLSFSFVQDNQSRSKKNVLRGLHYQSYPHAQTKLVRVLSGAILDIVVDLRVDKPTFGKSFTIELSSANHRQLLIPKGFAHGFLVLSDVADVFYKTDEYYQPASEGGINLLDEALELKQLFENRELTISDKDKNLPNFSRTTFKF